VEEEGPWSLFFANPVGRAMKQLTHKTEFVHIGSILDDVLKAYRREPGVELTAVWSLWDRVVGVPIADNAKPAAFKGRMLLVHVTSSTWMHQLQFFRKDIIDQLNHALGKKMIEEIKFKIGPV
jgi:predicted nucleic acid-binding Zn ribbon protein